jgi:uncharacterized DUF497 family protein
MEGEQFEWDAAKAESNFEKHGFEAACCVFDDAFASEHSDFESASGEVRYVITGMGNDVILMVVYTERGESTRIISARKATKHEQTEYYRGQTAE